MVHSLQCEIYVNSYLSLVSKEGQSTLKSREHSNSPVIENLSILYNFPSAFIVNQELAPMPLISCASSNMLIGLFNFTPQYC